VIDPELSLLTWEKPLDMEEPWYERQRDPRLPPNWEQVSKYTYRREDGHWYVRLREWIEQPDGTKEEHWHFYLDLRGGSVMHFGEGPNPALMSYLDPYIAMMAAEEAIERLEEQAEQAERRRRNKPPKHRSIDD
jgi:hypothetical protein